MPHHPTTVHRAGVCPHITEAKLLALADLAFDLNVYQKKDAVESNKVGTINNPQYYHLLL